MKENSNSGFLVGLMTLLIALVAGIGGYYIFTEVIQEDKTREEDEKTVEVKPEELSLEDSLKANQLTDFIDLLNKEGIDNIYKVEKESNITVFAVTNDGIKSAVLPEDKETLIKIIKGHFFQEALSSEDIVSVTSIKNILDESFPVLDVDGVIQIGDKAKIVHSDIKFKNGIIHVIDNVLIPTATTETVTPPVVVPAQ